MALSPKGSFWIGLATLYLRFALGAGFLSAVADRLGFWGPPGAHLVAWGNLHNFFVYTATLNPWLPASAAPVVGWIATVCETVFGICLILGIYTRAAASLSGLLALAFALGMSFGLGVKAPLDFSVFAVSASAFLLALVKDYPCSLDKVWRRKRPPVPR